MVNEFDVCIKNVCDLTRENDPKDRCLQFCQNAYMHGPAAILRSNGILRRCVWVLVFITGFGMTVYQLIELITKYNGWPTSTTFTLVSNSTMKFPAITICNVNPIRLSGVAATGENIQSLISNAVASQTATLSEWSSVTNDSSFYSSMDTDKILEFNFLYNYALLNDSVKVSAGHNISTMLLDCTFTGYHCSPENFTSFLNFKYGNCYTFNSGSHADVSYSQKSGPMYGLSLDLYIQQEEYIGVLSHEAGIRLTVHSQESMPFPEDHGISVAPGFKTTVALLMLDINRASSPHGNCVSPSDSDNKFINAWAAEENLNISYSESACLKTCYQKDLIKYCKCCSPFYPCDGDAFTDVIADLGGTVFYCDISNISFIKCQLSLEQMYENGSLTCDSLCGSACSEVDFEEEFSMSYWPSEAALNYTVNNLMQKSNDLNTKLAKMTSAEHRDFISKNVLRLEIYYKYLNFERITTSGNYEIKDLFSDIGGQFGLWLGLSIVSLYELCEIIFDLISICLLKLSKGNRTQSSDSIPREPQRTETMKSIFDTLDKPTK